MHVRKDPGRCHGYRRRRILYFAPSLVCVAFFYLAEPEEGGEIISEREVPGLVSQARKGEMPSHWLEQVASCLGGQQGSPLLILGVKAVLLQNRWTSLTR